VIVLEPKHRYAWNNLGRAYLGISKIDEAIRAFQKAVEVDPYDEYAYNNLGRTYWRQQQYDAAVGAFRKQLEINPLDEFAHGNLGAMYVEWHKYADALPELEKAASLKPDNAFYQVGLGQAYLNLGQPDKALAAFDKAVELQPSPLVWNDVAYELSQHKVHLERAQQYAESAIAATAAALRNTSLDHLRLEDLALVGQLAAYWDTLGWIHFQKGDLKQAEEFINAAWALDPAFGDRRPPGADLRTTRGQIQGQAPVRHGIGGRAPVPGTAHAPGKPDRRGAGERHRGQIPAKELVRARTLKLGPLVKDTAEASSSLCWRPVPRSKELNSSTAATN
jgi:tetratricopeptide (TPR) repeat protein